MVSYLDAPCRLHLLGGAGVVAGTQCGGTAGERGSSQGSTPCSGRGGEEASARGWGVLALRRNGSPVRRPPSVLFTFCPGTQARARHAEGARSFSGEGKARGSRPGAGGA